MTVDSDKTDMPGAMDTSSDMHGLMETHIPEVPVTVESSGTYPHPSDAVKVPVDRSKIKDTPTFAIGDAVDVTAVHNYLKHYGYMPTDAEASPKGKVAEETASALKAFQEFSNLSVDGVFGPETREAMSQDRCGFPDLVQSVDYTVLGPWTDRNIKYCFGAQSSQLNVDVCKNAIRRALNTWANVGVGLTFTEVAANQSPEVFVEFRPANDPDHSMVGGVVAHADFPPGFSVVVNGLPLPLHFDDQEHRWVDGAVANSFDIETVALHEMGHILGLAHSSVGGAVMYPFVSPNFLKRALADDDKQGIRNLYPVWRNLGGLYYGAFEPAPSRVPSLSVI